MSAKKGKPEETAPTEEASTADPVAAMMAAREASAKRAEQFVELLSVGSRVGVGQVQDLPPEYKNWAVWRVGNRNDPDPQRRQQVHRAAALRYKRGWDYAPEGVWMTGEAFEREGTDALIMICPPEVERRLKVAKKAAYMKRTGASRKDFAALTEEIEREYGGQVAWTRDGKESDPEEIFNDRPAARR